MTPSIQPSLEIKDLHAWIYEQNDASIDSSQKSKDGASATAGEIENSAKDSKGKQKEAAEDKFENGTSLQSNAKVRPPRRRGNDLFKSGNERSVSCVPREPERSLTKSADSDKSKELVLAGSSKGQSSSGPAALTELENTVDKQRNGVYLGYRSERGGFFGYVNLAKDKTDKKKSE